MRVARAGVRGRACFAPLKDRHRIELIRANLIEAEVNAEPQGELEINCPAKQLALFRCLRNIEPI
jgi:hypothetical protein